MVGESELAERTRALPGVAALLSVADGLAPCHLVGGAVRDLLLGREPVDVDVAVEGEAEPVARALAAALGGEVEAHERFGTATVVGRDDRDRAVQVNLARTRSESYPRPGALPEVAPATLAEDLARRDFTINAMAASLAAADLGALRDPHGGRADLEAGLVRVLHPASFADDPTRLLRAVRYAARLGFELEPDTERWGRQAIAAGAPATVSGQRIRDELLDLLAEDEAPRGAELLSDLRLDSGLHSGLRADPELIASAKLGAAETGADPALAALAALATATLGRDDRGGAAGGAIDGRRSDHGEGASAAGDLPDWIERLGLDARDRDAVVRAARDAPALAARLREPLSPSLVHRLLAPEPPEALALALALGAPAEPVLDFVARLRGVRLEIDGSDLIAAGVPESPALGRALAETLARKLDGELAGRDEELRTALALARGAS